jgi:RNA polymerase sigma-70 factor, ECF subfamily
MSFDEETDKDFRVALARGDESAWHHFHGLYTQRLIRYALVAVKDLNAATDLVQSVTLNLVRNRERLTQVENWEAYLFSTLRRELWRYRKQKIRRSAVNADYEREWIRASRDGASGYDAQLSSRVETQESVELALAKLSHEQREPIELRFFGELTFQQIASLLELPIGTVVSRYRSGLTVLRNYLGEET